MDNNRSPENKHRIINWFIHNSVAANLLMISILISGLYMIGFFGLFGQSSKLRLETFPERPITTVNITAGINGSTPEDVEQGVTDKIEQAIQGIQGIEKVTSETSSNRSRVRVKAVTNYDMDKLYDDIKMQVDTISNLPAEVEQVTVSKAAWQPSILRVTLHGDAAEKSIKAEAARLKARLLQNPYIERVDIDGERTAEVRIEVSEHRLQEYGLSISQIANAINNASLDLSSGIMETEQGDINLRIKGQAQTQKDYENLIIRAGDDGSLVRLGDVATVSDGFTEQQLYVGFNGESSLTLRLKSGKNTNVVEADKAATEIVTEYAETLPDNITATIWNNRVSRVKDRIDLFVKNSTMGMILVFLLLTIFLNLKLAFWVALGIPVSFAGALILMFIFDISINLITLFGFILVLGIVVDDAIIIGESIYSQKKRTNNQPDATIKGAAKVSVAATFGVLTTVAAFIPLTQVDTDWGNLLGQIGMVVIFCLLFSLVESKLILPSHLHRTYVAGSQHQAKNWWEKLQTSVAHGLEVLVEKTYMPLLSAALRQRYFTLMLFLAALILAAGLVLGRLVPISMMPRVESQDISLTVEMDNNSSVDETIAWAKKSAADLRLADKQLMKEQNSEHPNIINISAFNTDNSNFMVRAELAGADTRTLPAPLIANRWRETVGEIKGAKSVNFSSRRRWSDADIELQVLSNNRQDQQAAGVAIAAAIRQIDGVKDVTNSQDDADKEIRIELKPEAATYGITKSQLARAVRAAFYGEQAERIQRRDEEVRVMVRYPKTERKSLADLQNIYVNTQTGTAIPLSAVAELSFDRSPKSIEHIDGMRSLTVSANIDKDKTNNETIIAVLNEHILPKIQQQYGVRIWFGGDVEDDKKSGESMQLGFVISLVLIYVLLAIPLKSYTRPLIIMSAIPFGIIGAIFGHLILGMNMSMMSLFGIIALSGVVVNDSLLLLTTIQQHRNQGMSMIEAITVTGVRRFRPVILTSITTFVGLMPMLFETSFQAQFLIPMSVSLGFGILFATTITLILIPIVYAVFNDIKQLFWSETNRQPR